MILFIDNYDSFTYNLVDYFGQLEPNLLVIRNDKITLERIKNLRPNGIVLSPGPGMPENAGICNDLIATFYREIPILGICLGHQCIGAVFGAKIIRAPRPVHGKVSAIYHNREAIFTSLPSPFLATRYHSLVIERASLPPELKIIAESEDQQIMAIQHLQHPLMGLQFHPESIKTEVGFEIIQTWTERYIRNKCMKSKEDDHV